MAVVLDYLQTHLTNLQSEHGSLNQAVQRVIAKEVMQSYVLDFIYNHTQYKQLVFYGGTCARLIYGLNRMSEDLDFDKSAGVNLDHFAQDLQQHATSRLNLSGATVKVQGLQTGAIECFTLKLPILKELNLSPLSEEKLHVKVEVSSHKQQFQQQATPVARHNRSFVANHFDQTSLFAGKILACLERVWQQGSTNIHVKGRDYYDLIWYMQQRIKPLANKLEQDGQQSYTVKSAFTALDKRVHQLSRKDLQRDLTNLFANKDFIDNWLDHFHEFFDQYKRFYLQED